MRRIVFSLILSGLLVACSARQQSPWQQPFSDAIPGAINAQSLSQSDVHLRIAYLLPLSGESAKVGNAFRNAAMMAQFDLPDQHIETFFVDTKGTEAGALEALDIAESKRPDVILGPVFSAEVAAVRDEGASVPVISFTSDNSALGDGVYTTALLIPEQVDTMVNYACAQGKRRLALLGPENKVGELTLNTLQKSVQDCPDMVVETVALYGVNDVNLAPAVLKVSPKQIDPKKKDLTEEEIAELAKPISERINYDVLLVAEEGVKLKQVMSLLSYYDVSPRDVMMVGLSAAAAQGKDKAVRGMYFPAMPIRQENEFTQAYQKQFGEKPIAVAGYGYDAFMMTVFLKSRNALSEAGISNVGGYRGINGLIRFNRDGTNNRLLDIYQINPYGRSALVESARENFEQMPQEWFWSGDDTQDISDVQADFERRKQQIQEEMLRRQQMYPEINGMHENPNATFVNNSTVVAEDFIPVSEEESGY